MPDPKLIARFRQWADALDEKIAYANRPLTQNPTPKRNREYQSRLIEARNLERLQKALRTLADAHEAGTVPKVLAALKTKDEIGRLVHKITDGSKGGYYSDAESLALEPGAAAYRLRYYGRGIASGVQGFEPCGQGDCGRAAES
jgi:hypothetical protein